MLRLRFTLAALAVAGLGTTGFAQSACFSPDGLNGACWATVPATLPTFPGITLPATSICWTSCQPTQVCANLVLGAPAPLRCGVYTMPLQVTDCSATPLLTTAVNLDYTRTWLEVDPGGTTYQVWRFVAKADVLGVPPIAASCTVPTCLGPQPTAFYYGYVDYARNCTTGTFEASIVLFHNCDQFIHNPLFSSRPGVYHPGVSYALVGPSTAANPFMAAAAPAPVGQYLAEAMRNVPLPGGVLCFTEDPITGGMGFIINGCVCPFQLIPKQTTARTLRANGACVDPLFGPTTFQSINPGAPFPWLHDITTSIGTWTGAAGPYPGAEFVWVDETPALYRDSCSVMAFGEICYGASTSKGFQIVPVGGVVLTQNFSDIASNRSWTPPTAPIFPLVGNVLPTRNLLYTNVP